MWKPTLVEEKRFLNKLTDRNKPDKCHLWVGGKDSRGHGQLLVNGKLEKTHRLAYFLAYGSYNSRLCVLHSCKNLNCCNPNHLYLGTRSKLKKRFSKREIVI